MSLTTGTALTNASDVIDSVRAHLAADGWTTVIDNGTVGANNKEIWMNLPQANTFNNEFDLTIGMTVSGTDLIQITATPYTPAQARVSTSPKNTFTRVLGQPNISYANSSGLASRAPGEIGDTYPNGQVLTSAGTGDPVEVDKFNQGANYLNHWIFTPNNSPLGFSEQYFICVVEVASGAYRTFGAGESIKLGASGWVGGLWVDGSKIRSGTPTRSRYFAAADTSYSSFSDQGERGYILNYNAKSLARDTSSPATWNPWQHMSDPWSGEWSTVAGMGGTYGLGRMMVHRGTASFSGQTIRVPARLYAMDGIDSDANQMRPLAEIPDVFHMNIANFTPGETIVDDAESFLVVPYYQKTGTDNSGNYGFLVRHPDL